MNNRLVVRTAVLAALATVVAASAAVRVLGADPAPPAPGSASALDPQAAAMLHTTADAYGALSSYSDVERMTAPGMPADRMGSMTVRMKKPGSARIDAVGPKATSTIVCNPTGIYIVGSANPHKYAKLPASGTHEDIGRAIGLSPVPESGFVLLMLTNGDPYRAIAGGVQSASVEASSTVDGVPVDMVRIVPKGSAGRNASILLAIGQADHLIRQVTVSADGKTMVETRSNVKANPDILDSVFAFTPPPGSHLMTPHAPTSHAPRVKPGGRRPPAVKH